MRSSLSVDLNINYFILECHLKWHLIWRIFFDAEKRNKCEYKQYPSGIEWRRADAPKEKERENETKMTEVKSSTLLRCRPLFFLSFVYH